MIVDAVGGTAADVEIGDDEGGSKVVVKEGGEDGGDSFEASLSIREVDGVGILRCDIAGGEAFILCCG